MSNTSSSTPFLRVRDCVPLVPCFGMTLGAALFLVGIILNAENTNRDTKLTGQLFIAFGTFIFFATCISKVAQFVRAQSGESTPILPR